MSALLVPAVVDYIRAAFTPKEVALVQPYGGEFSGAELGKVRFACPAIFVTVLGWQQAVDGKRLTGRGARRTRMACFIATKHVQRDQRMLQAAALSDRLCTLLGGWKPANSPDAPATFAALEEDPSAENLYSRAIDDAGLALWLVDWQQATRQNVALTTPQLYDLTRIEIIDITHQGGVPPAPGPGGVVPTVTEDVQFLPLTPTNP